MCNQSSKLRHVSGKWLKGSRYSQKSLWRVLIFRDSCVKKRLVYFVYGNKYIRVRCLSGRKSIQSSRKYHHGFFQIKISIKWSSFLSYQALSVLFIHTLICSAFQSIKCQNHLGMYLKCSFLDCTSKPLNQNFWSLKTPNTFTFLKSPLGISPYKIYKIF